MANCILISHFFLQILLSREDLASLCAKSERYIGTEGGGMDQAIAFLAKSGTLLTSQFNLNCSFVEILPNTLPFYQDVLSTYHSSHLEQQMLKFLQAWQFWLPTHLLS